MKTLLHLRHAQAGHEGGKSSDLDRPLTDKGFLEARRVSFLLAKRGIIPEKIVSSHARRALSTAYVFAANFGSIVGQVEPAEPLYDSAPEDYLKLISSIDDSVSSCLIVGHNNVITEVAGKLLEKEMETMRTCEVLIITAETEHWHTFDSSSCWLQLRVYPELVP